MAREIRIERMGGRPDSERAPAVEPATTEEARRAIEETRGRISATLDEIEDRIGEARENIRERMDVARPIRDRMRRNPLPGIGVALGVGVALGLLTGGGKKKEKHPKMLDEDEREALRRWRAERRDRLREQRRRGRGESGGPSLARQIGGAVASAVIAGLMTRARRKITGESAGEAGKPHVASASY